MINKLRKINDKTYTWKQEFRVMLKMVKLFQLTENGNKISNILKKKNQKPEEMLVNCWEIILHDFVEKYQYEPGGIIDLFYSERKNFEELSQKESRSDFNKEGVAFKTGPLTLRDVITAEFIKEIKRHFLSALNKTLYEIEKLAIERSTIFLKKGQSNLTKESCDAYNVEIIIYYFIQNYNEAAYTFSSTFNYHKVVIEKNYGKFLKTNNERNIYRGQTLPELKESYSFLLVDIINNSSLRDKIFEIETIEADIIYNGYKGSKNKKEKDSFVFQYNHQVKIFTEMETNNPLQLNAPKDLQGWEIKCNELLSKTKKASNEELNTILEQVRNGNINAIEKLVESSEWIILSVLKSFQNELVGINDLLETGKKELIKLAKQEINSEARSGFFRFAAWNIRQAFLTKIKETENKRDG